MFYGLSMMVAICHINDSRADASAVETMLERIKVLNEVQAVRLVNQSQNVDAFFFCRGIFREELLVAVAGAAVPPQSALTAEHVRHLVDFGYTICDHFADDTAVNAVCELANASLDLREARLDKDAPAADGVHWITPQPRTARKDVTTWLGDGHPLGAPLAPVFDLLQSDLCSIAHLRCKREMQLACYPGPGDGYKRHTDARPEIDMQGAERKVTAIVYCNRDWRVEHGGALQLRLADHQGGGVLNVSPPPPLLPLSLPLSLLLSSSFLLLLPHPSSINLPIPSSSSAGS